MSDETPADGKKLTAKATVSFGDALDEYAAETGKRVEDLNDFDSGVAFLRAVLSLPEIPIFLEVT